MRISDWSSDVCSSDLPRTTLVSLLRNPSSSIAMLGVDAGRAVVGDQQQVVGALLTGRDRPPRRTPRHARYAQPTRAASTRHQAPPLLGRHMAFNDQTCTTSCRQAPCQYEKHQV